MSIILGSTQEMHVARATIGLGNAKICLSKPITSDLHLLAKCSKTCSHSTVYEVAKNRFIKGQIARGFAMGCGIGSIGFIASPLIGIITLCAGGALGALAGLIIGLMRIHSERLDNELAFYPA